MRLFNISQALFLLVAFGSLAACAGATGPEDDARSDESEVKKKVSPTSRTGVFELSKPAWYMQGAVGEVSLSGTPLVVGSRTELAPGKYSLTAPAIEWGGGRTMGQVFDDVAITPGNVAKRIPAGLRVRFGRPLTMGFVSVDLIPRDGTPGRLDEHGSWSRLADGALMIAAPGVIQVKSYYLPTPQVLTLIEGRLAEVVLPTAGVGVSLDAYDPAYPTPQDCKAPFIRANAEEAPVRDANGVVFGGGVIAYGPNAEVMLDSYGIVSRIDTSPNSAVIFTLNRLEVDDLSVTDSNGATRSVRGSFYVERKEPWSQMYRQLGCTPFPTHHGIDLPDGDYRVTSYADAPEGHLRHTELVSFP